MVSLRRKVYGDSMRPITYFFPTDMRARLLTDPLPRPPLSSDDLALPTRTPAFLSRVPPHGLPSPATLPLPGATFSHYPTLDTP